MKIQIVPLSFMVSGKQAFPPYFYTAHCLMPPFAEAQELIGTRLTEKRIWAAWDDMTSNKTHLTFYELNRLCRLFNILISLQSTQLATKKCSVPPRIRFPNKRLELCLFAQLCWPATTELHVLRKHQTSIIHPEFLKKPREQYLKAAGLRALTDSGSVKLMANIPQDLEETEDTKRLQRVLRSKKFLDTLLLLQPTGLQRQSLQKSLQRVEVRVMDHIRLRFGEEGAPIMSREQFVLEEIQQPPLRGQPASLANKTYFLFTKKHALAHALASLLHEHLKLEVSPLTLEMLLLEEEIVEAFVQEETSCVLLDQVTLGENLLPQHEGKLQWSWEELEESETVVYTERRPFRYAQVSGVEKLDAKSNKEPRFLLVGLSKRVLVTPRCFIARISSVATGEMAPSANKLKSEFSRLWSVAEKKTEVVEQWKQAKKEGEAAMKLALKAIKRDIHPDKNPGNQENAEILFKWFCNHVEKK